MRWDSTITLVHRERVAGDDCSYSESVKTESTVFCNRNTVGHSTLVAWTDTAVKPIAAVQMHNSDYDGQEAAVLDGEEYSVERVSRKGDYVTLTLGRMGRNV